MIKNKDNESQYIDLCAKLVANKISPAPNSTLWNWGYKYAKMGIEEWIQYNLARKEMLETPAPPQKVIIPKLPNI